jgi:hypothetical protein
MAESGNFTVINPPLDENGKPMTVVSFYMEELVPTVQFGNAKMGANAMTWTSDTPEARKAGIAQLTYDVREIMGKERNTVLAVLREKRIQAAQQ